MYHLVSCSLRLLRIGCLALWLPTFAQPYTLLSGWPEANGNIRAMVLDGGANVLYVGGEFTMIGGQARERLAAIDLLTGTLTGWDPGANGNVLALALAGSTVYAGGEFSMVGGASHGRVAAIDAATGTVSAWDPGLNNTVYALLSGPTAIYVGGFFTDSNGSTRNRAAAFDLSTGVLLPWDPNAGTIVRALAWNGPNILLGGGFGSIGPDARNRLAEVDPVLGIATPWNPNANAVVTTLAVDGARVYAGGIFTSVGGQARGALAAIDGTTGDVLPWAPSVSGVQHVNVHGGAVLVGGFFTTVNGTPHGNMAILDPVTGSLAAGSPSASSTVYGIVRTSTHLFLGGAFAVVNATQLRGRFAAFSACTASNWYADTDNDEFGDPASIVIACTQPLGYIADNTDCDDTNFAITGPGTWYADLDGDGVGNPLAPIVDCTQPPNSSGFNTDCDDTNELIYAGADCDDGNPRSYQDRYDLDCVCLGRPARIAITVFLEGPFDGTEMRTDLLDAGLIPLQEPYTALGYTFINGGGGETALPEDLDAPNDDFDAVDWVVVELRNLVAPHAVVESHACLVRRNGAVTTPIGNEAEFPNSDPADYQIAIRHRNHLGVMTIGGVSLGGSDGVAELHLPTTATYGTDAMEDIDGTMVMRMGNTDFSDNLRYMGLGNDRDPILQLVGGSVPTNTVPGYFGVDSNLDGVVRYVGTNNDRDPILSNIGGTEPTHTLFEQLPPP